jgi:formate dehydrogenase maturation protein FdhE
MREYRKTHKQELSVANRKWREANRERIREYQHRSRKVHSERAREYDRQWREKHPGYDREIQQKHYYGMLPGEYEQRLAEQNGVCAICGDTPKKSLGVDHNHKTGAIRGLLCDRCNVGLGCFADIPERLRKAADYLKRNL